MLPSDCVIRIHFRDISDCCYAESVDEERLQRQVLGPRVPVSWFRNLEDTSIDFLTVDGVEPWRSSNFVENPIHIAVDPRRLCQIAVVAVIMGDLNAVYAVVAASSPTPVRRVLANSDNVDPKLCFSRESRFAAC